MEDNKNSNKGFVFVVLLLVITLIVCVILLVTRIAGRIETAAGEGGFFTELFSRTPEREPVEEESIGLGEKEEVLEKEPEKEPEETPEKESLEVQPTKPALQETLDVLVRVEKVSCEIVRCLEEKVYVVVQEDAYGLTDMDGNWLVKPKYSGYVDFDEETVTFRGEKGERYLYDLAGNLLCEYQFFGGTYTTEDGIEYTREVYCTGNIRTEIDTGADGSYFQVHYYNMTTGELIFETNGLEYEVHSFSRPDHTGTAVVIAGIGYENTVYLITADGYTENMFWEPDVERRYYRFTENDVWSNTYLRDGWQRTLVEELRGGLLDYSTVYKETLYNVHTGERVTIPEKYQNYYGEYYQYTRGLYYGIAGESLTSYYEGTSDYVYYALCHGSELLSEEIYRWLNFGDTYIVAGNERFAHILDYGGNVLAEYRGIAYPFINGKTLVLDDTGVFFIDETLKPCTGYIMKDVSYIRANNYIYKDGEHYLITYPEGEGQEE